MYSTGASAPATTSGSASTTDAQGIRLARNRQIRQLQAHFPESGRFQGYRRNDNLDGLGHRLPRVKPIGNSLWDPGRRDYSSQRPMRFQCTFHQCVPRDQQIRIAFPTTSRSSTVPQNRLSKLVRQLSPST